MERNLRKHCNKLHLQRGASLLEGIAYLGVAAVVVLGAVSLLTSAFSSAQTNRVVEELVSIRTAVKKLYMGQPGVYPAGSLNQSLATVRALPSSLAVNTTDWSITNAWNGAVAITGAGATFTISYAGIPRAECVSILSGVTGWTSVAQGSNTVTAFPITPAVAASTCAASGNSTVVFTSN